VEIAMIQARANRQFMSNPVLIPEVDIEKAMSGCL